ncbi:MAG: mechanosensitive ion channel family protein [Coxiellaceae bacterium]|jgi:small-conductance mechanosensitive channel|nr:mechanosensitive ion channel family protein [Coxiellaceae bacterium]
MPLSILNWIFKYWQILLVVILALGVVVFRLCKKWPPQRFYKQYKQKVKTLVKNVPHDYLVLFTKYWKKPLLIGATTVAICIILPSSIKNSDIYNQASKILTIIIITWLAIQIIKTIRDIIIKDGFKYHSNLNAQRINTQVGILVKIVILVLVIIGVSLVLVTFPQIREIGISILASAGIAGITVGFAAQKSLGNILAGIQIAFTQPIKIGDEVIIENETGIIEEINLTYVVIRALDKRRAIIPINYFIEKAFQNLTRNSSNLLGIVYIDVNYNMPISKIREALDAILNETNLWDGKIKDLQVTNTKPQAVELRILASASNPTNAWDLKCFIREKLICFLQKEYPHCLPKLRVEIEKQP